MAKNFPYFKFRSDRWLTGDIVFEDFTTQALFINICALLWQRDGDLNVNDVTKRYSGLLGEGPLTDSLAKLTDRFIYIKEGKICVKFIEEQFSEVREISATNSENGKKGGRPKSLNDNNKKANKTDRLATESDRQAKRKEKKREKNKENTKESLDKNILKVEHPVVPRSEMTGPMALDEKTISGYQWIDQNYLESVLAWQHYKISRSEGFSYEHSLKSFLKRLKSISNGIPEKAKMIVEYSMGKQYKDVYVPTQEEQNIYFANGKDVSKVSHGGKNVGSIPESWLKKAIKNG